MNPRLCALLVLCLLASLSAGCSISKSSETISDSLTSPFRWSSDSSGSDDDEQAYQRDLSDYAASYARSGGDLDAFRTAVRQRAAAQGISNWQEDAFTCASIGYGLQIAELDTAQVDQFAQDLLAGHPRGVQALYAGYAAIP
jgi:hypothetical protein